MTKKSRDHETPTKKTHPSSRTMNLGYLLKPSLVQNCIQETYSTDFYEQEFTSSKSGCQTRSPGHLFSQVDVEASQDPAKSS